ncbi:arylsulfotransferase family protein [Aurantiacibacter spongiae]|uniref:Uncharacterized protein n=1 Tax=Aurantiacibacter spongiae TaxID=2488860 RepID=A0A3N5CPY0_9SPHN|nr:arylsulfotransferase family protein [Aurantiacibacter spongiae]RPF71064.1 hypothetical protein EG799_05130 [Aurantiacibacter spongiae]
MTPVNDGTFWIPGQFTPDETPAGWVPQGTTPRTLNDKIETDYYYHDAVVLMDGNGRTLKKLSVLKAIVDAGLEGALYQSMVETTSDATHLNDIGIVTAPLAARIEGVKPGDILVSLRAMNMLAILDKDTGALEWHKQGPWLRQHDPDIMPDGTIEIFNNRNPLIGWQHPGSQILRYDPATENTAVVFPKGRADAFETDTMGVHQTMANGNRLITETRAGRIFEVTPSGEVVWDYRLPYDEDYAAMFTFGMHVPDDYFDKGIPRCSS